MLEAGTNKEDIELNAKYYTHSKSNYKIQNVPQTSL